MPDHRAASWWRAGRAAAAALMGACLIAACGGGSGDAAAAISADLGTGAGSATLRWNSVPDSDLAGYRVYVGTAPGSYLQSRGAGIDTGASTRFEVTGLAPGRTYFFSVTAYDSVGNESDFAAEVTKTVE